MFIKSFIFIAATAAICECYHNDIGVKGSIKSYGGYFPDTNNFNQPANDLAYSPTYHRPIVSSYQPYGWNFNQPTRTYGGVNVLPRQNYNYGATGNYGWANSGWNTRINPSPAIPAVPQVPNLFQPNFVPPVYFPGSFQYPNFGGYPNLFPQFNPGFGYQAPVYPATGTVGIGGPVVTDNTPAIVGTGGTAGVASNGVAVARPAVPIVPVVPGGSGVLNQGEILPGSGSSGGGGSASGGGGGSSSGGGSSGSGGGGSSSSGGGGGSSSSGGGGSGGGTTFTTSSFDSENSASNQGGVYAFPQNPFYSPSTQQPKQRPTVNQYIPPYPTQRPSHPHPDDQTAFESNNQQEVQRPIAPIPGSKKPSIELSRFPSSSLFGENRSGWTDDDEMKWQATTKAPYFENKAPGLECTLPAAAVLGAMSAMKVSSLLPLNVPSGKPILSCNATELLQAQINLNGKIYDCKDASITVSCSSRGECPSETLECDVNMRQMDAYSVTCTNGTLISNSNIVCESATLTVGKNVLNCYYKDAVRQRPVSVIPLQPTPAPVNEDFQENSLEQRGQLEADESELAPQVKKAMRNVFPHELLAMPATMYLPQEQSLSPQISAELRKHVDGYFKTDLLASSQTQGSDDNKVCFMIIRKSMKQL